MDLIGWLIVIASVIVGIGRMFVPGHGASWPGTYEAFAHIFVGALIAIAITKPIYRKVSLWSLLLITVFEAFKFFTR